MTTPSLTKGVTDYLHKEDLESRRKERPVRPSQREKKVSVASCQVPE